MQVLLGIEKRKLLKPREDMEITYFRRDRIFAEGYISL